MAHRCAEPLCSVHDSGGVFRLFRFPSDVTLQNCWLLRLSASPRLEQDVDGNTNAGEDLFLCEIHFKDDSWDDLEHQTLKELAVPSVFQHNMLLVYINTVCDKLNMMNIHTEIGDKGMLAIEKLEAKGTLEDVEVQKELLLFSKLMVSSALQEARIKQKSALLAAIEDYNTNLSEEINELTLKLNASDS